MKLSYGALSTVHRGVIASWDVPLKNRRHLKTAASAFLLVRNHALKMSSKSASLGPQSIENTSLPMHSTGECGRRLRHSVLSSGELDLLPMNMTTSGQRCASVIFKRSNAAYGSEQPMKLSGPKFGLSTK